MSRPHPSDGVTPNAVRARRYRRRKAMGATLVKIALPSDVLQRLEAEGISIDDEEALGELIEIGINARVTL